MIWAVRNGFVNDVEVGRDSQAQPERRDNPRLAAPKGPGRLQPWQPKAWSRLIHFRFVLLDWGHGFIIIGFEP